MAFLAVKKRIAACKDRLSTNITQKGQSIGLSRVRPKGIIDCIARGVAGVRGKENTPIQH